MRSREPREYCFECSSVLVEMSAPQLTAKLGWAPLPCFEASRQFRYRLLRGAPPTPRTCAPARTIFASLPHDVHKANRKENSASRLHMVLFEHPARATLDHTSRRYQEVVVPSVSKEIVQYVA